MNFGVILAGGVGHRMGADKPKQFLHIGEKPIIVHTVEKFALYRGFEKVIVLTPEEWIEYTKDVLQKYLGNLDNVVVIQGGAVRNETIMNAVRYIEENYGLDDAIMVTHDAVRPFVTYRIIEENTLTASTVPNEEAKDGGTSYSGRDSFETVVEMCKEKDTP